MVFKPEKTVTPLRTDPPDAVSIPEFMLDEKWGRLPLQRSRAPFTCGLSGKQYSMVQVRDRVDALARSLATKLDITPNEGSEWDKVVAIYSVNTIDTLVVSWAIQSLSGISTPANAAYSEEELVYQLKSSGARALFTSLPQLPIAIAAAGKTGIPEKRIYVLSLPKEVTAGATVPKHLKSVDNLIEEGSKLAPLESLRWSKGQGARQTAFLCYSSGTSGLPKGVMVSHRNVITNVLQLSTFEERVPSSKRLPGDKHNPTENVLGLLPQSHIYGLVVICHLPIYRGDQVIILPKFEMGQCLGAIQRFKINRLYLVPPIIIAMANNEALLRKFDLSSVDSVFTGAAPLGAETAERLHEQHPSWIITQGYGLTETCTVVCSTPMDDIWYGSCGLLLPSFQIKLLSPEGQEITKYEQPGEMLVKSPSIVLGYLNNDKANKETFQDGWMRTGDEAVVRLGPKGTEHIFITDRIKELIKVKGLQVAPAELEAHLLSHPTVADCAVIPIPDDRAGEVPKAYIVKSSSVGLEEGDHAVKRAISKHVKDHKARHKWLDGGIEFIDAIPKSPSGKILRRLLRDRNKQTARKDGPRL